MYSAMVSMKISLTFAVRNYLKELSLRPNLWVNGSTRFLTKYSYKSLMLWI